MPTIYQSLYSDHRGFSNDRIDEMYAEVVDRWTWDTGSKKDRILLEKLDAERRYRKNVPIGGIAITIQSVDAHPLVIAADWSVVERMDKWSEDWTVTGLKDRW